MTKRSKNWLILALIFLGILLFKKFIAGTLGIIAILGIVFCGIMFFYINFKSSGSSK